MIIFVNTYIFSQVYSYYKNVSACTHLEMSLKHKLEVLKSNTRLTMDSTRIVSLLQQRTIQLLGRSINFSFILAQNINNKIYRDVDFAIKRFESSDARGVVELKVSSALFMCNCVIGLLILYVRAALVDPACGSCSHCCASAYISGS